MKFETYMASLMLLSGVVTTEMSCKREFHSISKSEAEIRASDLTGRRMFCEGEDGDPSYRDRTSAWTCMPFNNEQGGHVTYDPEPVVVCLDEKCHKIGPQQTTAEASK